MQMLMKVGWSDLFGKKGCLLLKIISVISLLPWSWKDRICSRTSKSDWRFGSGGENRCNILPWIDNLTAVNMFEFENQVEYLKLHRAKLEKAQLVFGWRVVHFWGQKKNGPIRWPNDAWIVCCSDPSRQSVKVKATSQRVNELHDIATSPRVGCNCHRIRSRTEIFLKLCLWSTHWSWHVRLWLCERRWNKVRKYSKMCQVCRCGWQGTSLPAVCPCQGSHLRHFQEREGETVLIHYGLNCRWPHLVVSVSDQKHSDCVTNFCRLLRNWLKFLRNSKMIMGEIVCNLV